MTSRRSRPLPVVPSSAFRGFRFPPEIVVLGVRWYLRFGLLYRDVEELLAERGIEVVTDRAPALGAAIDEHIPTASHNTERYENNRVECDHSRLKARLRPMRGLKRDHTARVIVRGHALMQNLRRGHYELGVETRAHRRVAIAFTELAERSERERYGNSVPHHCTTQRNNAGFEPTTFGL
jgi:transposase-like protein